MSVTFESAFETLPLTAQRRVRSAINQDRDAQGNLNHPSVAGLHCLIYWKLQSPFMQDLADAMELCKEYLDIMNVEHVLDRTGADDEIVEKFRDLIRKAPLEIAGERRLGQGNPQNYRHLKDS